MALVNLQESCPARANDRVRSLPQRYATKTALACCMSTVQLPKLADRCPARAHDRVRSLRRRNATERFRCSMKLPQPGLAKRCFECIPARSVLRDGHCVPSALVGARQVRLIREPSGQ